MIAAVTAKIPEVRVEERVTRLEAEMEHVRRDIGDMKLGIRELGAKIDTLWDAVTRLSEKMLEGFARIDVRFAGVETRFVALDARLDAMDSKSNARFDAGDAKFETALANIDGRFDAMDKKFDAKFDVMDRKFDAKFDVMDRKFDARFDAMDEKFDAKLAATRAELNGSISSFKIWALLLYIALAASLFGVLARGFHWI